MLTQEFTTIERTVGLVAQVGRVLEAQQHLVVMEMDMEGETWDVVWCHHWDETKHGELRGGFLPTEEETQVLGCDSCMGPRQKGEVHLKQCKAGTDRGGGSCKAIPTL